jgi:signal transduction histidine kinase
MHPVLDEQLRASFGSAQDAPANLQPMIAALDAALKRAERERDDLAESMCTLAAELVERNEQLEKELEDRARLELELRRSQKLEAVGQLASGVAHEINTPVQFIGDSVFFVRDAFDVIDALRAKVDSYAAEDPPATTYEERWKAIEALAEELDADYMLRQIPRAVGRALDGIERVSSIVKAMKGFAHPDAEEKLPVDLNQSIVNTLTVARHEIKYVAEVETRLSDLEPVLCHGGDINQVLLNLVINAAHAIGDVVGESGQKGLLTVETRQEDGWVEIMVGDTGSGIPEAIRERVFDPFFTTKEVGRGTGQGLAIAHSIIERHGGTIRFETEVGVGTTFRIRLPSEGLPGVQEAAA